MQCIYLRTYIYISTPAIPTPGSKTGNGQEKETSKPSRHIIVLPCYIVRTVYQCMNHLCFAPIDTMCSTP